MCKKVVISLCTFCFISCLIIVSNPTLVDAYLNGLAYGANPALLDLDLDLDYLTRLAAVDTETGAFGGLYGIYGTGGLYGLYGLGTLPLLNYIGYLFGTYGTNIDTIYTNPAGLGPNILTGYGFTYHPLFGYYQPIDLFGSMFALTNLFTWW